MFFFPGFEKKKWNNLWVGLWPYFYIKMPTFSSVLQNAISILCVIAIVSLDLKIRATDTSRNWDILYGYHTIEHLQMAFRRAHIRCIYSKTVKIASRAWCRDSKNKRALEVRQIRICHSLCLWEDTQIKRICARYIKAHHQDPFRSVQVSQAAKPTGTNTRHVGQKMRSL